MHEMLQVDWPKYATMSFNNIQISKVKQLGLKNIKLTQLFQNWCPFLADQIIRKRDLTLKTLLENNNNSFHDLKLSEPDDHTQKRY